MSGTDSMCDDGRNLVRAIREIDDRRPHGQVKRMAGRLLLHIEKCTVCKDNLGATGDLLCALGHLAGPDTFKIDE